MDTPRQDSRPQDRNRSPGSIGWLVIGVAGFFCLCQCQSSPPNSRAYASDQLWPDRVPSGQIDFIRDVQPLLEDQCLECHNATNAHEFAGLNLETRETALRTGRSAPVIVPGDPAKSLLISVLKRSSDHPLSMPAAPEKIAGVRLAILKKWIAQGAPWPPGVQLSQQ